MKYSYQNVHFYWTVIPQLAGHSGMPSLERVLVLFSWMMSSAAQALTSYWSVSVAQS